MAAWGQAGPSSASSPRPRSPMRKSSSRTATAPRRSRTCWAWRGPHSTSLLARYYRSANTRFCFLSHLPLPRLAATLRICLSRESRIRQLARRENSVFLKQNSWRTVLKTDSQRHGKGPTFKKIRAVVASDTCNRISAVCVALAGRKKASEHGKATGRRGKFLMSGKGSIERDILWAEIGLYGEKSRTIRERTP